uniref:Uncharacterized protein n=1 Tax=Oncorhynchus kisutch TaxID=8019 RepID=A0A8C7MIT8_ONCKI
DVSQIAPYALQTFLTGVECCFEGLDVSGHPGDPVDSHLIDPPLLHLFNALADYVRHLGALAPVGGHYSSGLILQYFDCN